MSARGMRTKRESAEERAFSGTVTEPSCLTPGHAWLGQGRQEQLQQEGGLAADTFACGCVPLTQVECARVG